MWGSCVLLTVKRETLVFTQKTAMRHRRGVFNRSDRDFKAVMYKFEPSTSRDVHIDRGRMTVQRSPGQG